MRLKGMWDGAPERLKGVLEIKLGMADAESLGFLNNVRADYQSCTILTDYLTSERIGNIGGLLE